LGIYNEVEEPDMKIYYSPNLFIENSKKVNLPQEIVNDIFRHFQVK